MRLTNCERFVRLFMGQPVDRAPFLQFMGAWSSSVERWKREGLARDVTRETLWQAMGFDSFRGHFLPVACSVVLGLALVVAVVAWSRRRVEALR